jgi:hypothetical protein
MSTEKNKVLEPSTLEGQSLKGQTTPKLREGHALHLMANVTRMLKAAGTLAILAAAQWVLLVIVAETQYPNYSPQLNCCSHRASSSLLRPISGTPRSS